MDPVIVTPRLLLRPMMSQDLDALFRMYRDPETMKHIGPGEVYSLSETRVALERTIRAYRRDGYGLLTTILRSTGETVGRCGNKAWSVDGVEEMEIGWMIAAPHRGKGYATEAAIGLRDYSFDVLGRDRVISVIQPGNEASVRVAEKIGERYWREWVADGVACSLYRVDRESLDRARARPTPPS